MSIIKDLDVIITSCTSIGHIAAAMGKKTIIITPISAYYTWSYDESKNDKCPWYGRNLTLLRQTKPRSWLEPLSELKEIFWTENISTK